MEFTGKNVYAGKNVLITGGLGFIGSNLACNLVKLGAKVTLIDSMVESCGANPFNISGIKNKVKVVISDIRDNRIMATATKNQDYIFNLAGQVSHIDSMDYPYEDLELNTASHICLLEACRHYNPEAIMVYTSTRQVYGRPEYLPVDENHPLCPIDVNGINKIAAEHYHLVFNKVYGMRSIVLRLTNTYGPRQLVKHNRQGFVGWFVRKIVKKEKIRVFGDGNQLRDLNYVEDAVSALLSAASYKEAYGQIFNLGMEKPVSLKQLVEIMIKVAGCGSYELVPFPKEKKKIDIGSIYTDFSKLNALTGWSPKKTLEEGLKETFEFYRKNGRHYW